MLRQGYHHSFRELFVILAWQREDRERLGAEHPLHQRPLLDAETDKLRLLCTQLNKAEEAERRCRSRELRRKAVDSLVLGEYSVMYKSYLELAAYFLTSDDQWLSDFFYEKNLMVAQKYPQLDPQLTAEAFLNVGLAYERRGLQRERENFTQLPSADLLGDLMKALHSFEKYRYFSDDFPHLKADACLQLTRLYMKLAERATDQQALQYMIRANTAAADGKLETADREHAAHEGTLFRC
jgi:hypothetical protein